MRKMESNLVAFARVLGNTTFHVIGLFVFVIIQRQCSVQWRSSQKRVTLPFVSDYFFCDESQVVKCVACQAWIVCYPVCNDATKEEI